MLQLLKLYLIPSLICYDENVNGNLKAILELVECKLIVSDGGRKSAIMQKRVLFAILECTDAVSSPMPKSALSPLRHFLQFDFWSKELWRSMRKLTSIDNITICTMELIHYWKRSIKLVVKLTINSNMLLCCEILTKRVLRINSGEKAHCIWVFWYSKFQ